MRRGMVVFEKAKYDCERHLQSPGRGRVFSLLKRNGCFCQPEEFKRISALKSWVNSCKFRILDLNFPLLFRTRSLLTPAPLQSPAILKLNLGHDLTGHSLTPQDTKIFWMLLWRSTILHYALCWQLTWTCMFEASKAEKSLTPQLISHNFINLSLPHPFKVLQLLHRTNLPVLTLIYHTGESFYFRMTRVILILSATRTSVKCDQ